MRKGGLLCLLFLLSFAGTTASHAAPPGDAGLWSDPDARTVTLWFFWTETCPHCLDAHPFVEALPERYPWLRVESRELLRSVENRRLFEEMGALTGAGARAVPAFFWCGESMTGFDRPEGMGRVLLAALADCHLALLGELPPGFDPQDIPRGDADTRVTLPLLGSIDAAALPLPLLTLVLGGLDAFNPCAFFVLLFLLSMLTHTRDRRLMLIVGGVFLSISGIVYFLFMAAWLNVFLFLGELRAITLVAGLLAVVMGGINIKDWFWFRRGVSLTLTDSQKSRLFARMRRLMNAESRVALVTGTALLAVVANSYELLCTAGFPMVYTRILTLHDLTSLGYYLWLALYNVVYVLPLAVIVIVFVFTLGARKLGEIEGRALKLLSGLMMLGLGTLLVIAPQALGNVLVAVGLLAASLLVTWLVVRAERARMPSG